MTAAAGIAVFLFFLLVEPFHLRFQEQYQMFLFSSDYFLKVAAVPGGFADWIGRCLTQFMLYPWLGALIVALLFCEVQHLTFRNSVRKDLTAFALSFVPAALLVVFFCNKDALLSVFTAAIIGLDAAKLTGNGKCGKPLQYIIIILLTVVMYFLCGSLGAVFFLAASFSRSRNLLLTIAGLAALMLSVLAARFIFNYPFTRLLCGIHYGRYHDNIPVLPWIAAASVWIFYIIFKKADAKAVYGYISYGVVLVALGLGMFAGGEPAWEEMMKYSTYAQDARWDKILKSAQKKAPASPLSMNCLNLALAKTYQLGDFMFRFEQEGPDALFYPYRREHMSPIPSSVVYWNLGFINTSQRFTFAAEEVIPDYQKSSWCHKRLAQIYLVKGQYDVARKYLEPLKYTLFYRGWAKETEKLLADPSQIDSHPVYSVQRALDLKEQNSMYSLQEMYTPLLQHIQENDANAVARQYLLGWCLLNCDLDRFAEYLEPERFKTMPMSYQEAYVLYWSGTHDSPEGMPDFVSEKVVNRFMNFTSDAYAIPESMLRARYSNTYWYYFITHDNAQN